MSTPPPPLLGKMGNEIENFVIYYVVLVLVGLMNMYITLYVVSGVGVGVHFILGNGKSLRLLTNVTKTP